MIIILTYDTQGTLKVASLLPLRVYKDSYPYQLYVDNLNRFDDRLNHNL